MQLHELKRKNKNRTKKIIGRGGKRGTTSGRGTKGQKARAGRKLHPEIRDMIKKIPKLRGYRFKPVEAKAFPLNLYVIERSFGAGETVSPQTLVLKKVMTKSGGQFPEVKILGSGNLTKKIIVSGCEVSASAREKIEKVGGEIK